MKETFIFIFCMIFMCSFMSCTKEKFIIDTIDKDTIYKDIFEQNNRYEYLNDTIDKDTCEYSNDIINKQIPDTTTYKPELMKWNL